MIFLVGGETDLSVKGGTVFLTNQTQGTEYFKQ